MKEGKIWGETTEVVATPFFSVHYLAVNAGGFCSEHKHDAKANVFFVLEGRLKIRIWREGGILDELELGPGEETTIKPGLFHQFEAVENTLAIEICRVELDEADISRRTQGGIKYRET